MPAKRHWNRLAGMRGLLAEKQISGVGFKQTWLGTQLLGEEDPEPMSSSDQPAERGAIDVVRLDAQPGTVVRAYQRAINQKGSEEIRSRVLLQVSSRVPREIRVEWQAPADISARTRISIAPIGT